MHPVNPQGIDLLFHRALYRLYRLCRRHEALCLGVRSVRSARIRMPRAVVGLTCSAGVASGSVTWEVRDGHALRNGRTLMEWAGVLVSGGPIRIGAHAFDVAFTDPERMQARRRIARSPRTGRLPPRPRHLPGVRDHTPAEASSSEAADRQAMAQETRERRLRTLKEGKLHGACDAARALGIEH